MPVPNGETTPMPVTTIRSVALTRGLHPEGESAVHHDGLAPNPLSLRAAEEGHDGRYIGRRHRLLVGSLLHQRMGILVDVGHDARERVQCRGLNRSWRSEEHTSELQSPMYLVCRL